MNFSRAIVRKPGRSMVNGLTGAGLGLPDYREAIRQHAAYVSALRECGLQVIELDPDEEFPDSTFVEDVALVTPRFAVITSPGAPSRKGEIITARTAISGYFSDIEEIIPPGTVEAGDIMMVGDHYYIGLSERSNLDGAEQLIRILGSYGMTGSVIRLEKVLHLKTGVSYLENNYLLVSGEFLSRPEFRDFNIIEVPAAEAYAANSLWINGKVLVPAGNPVTKGKILAAGYQVIELEISEFRKLDGGLSCLSLRW